MDGLKYHRILLKLSGEALAGEDGFGIDPQPRPGYCPNGCATCVKWVWMWPL